MLKVYKVSSSWLYNLLWKPYCMQSKQNYFSLNILTFYSHKVNMRSLSVVLPSWASGNTVLFCVAVGSGAPECAPQAVVDPGPTRCTTPSYCSRAGDHQGSTGPFTATTNCQESDTYLVPLFRLISQFQIWLVWLFMYITLIEFYSYCSINLSVISGNILQTKRKRLRKNQCPDSVKGETQGSLFLANLWCLLQWSYWCSSWFAIYHNLTQEWRSHPAMQHSDHNDYLKRVHAWWQTQCPSWQNCPLSALLLVRHNTQVK